MLTSITLQNFKGIGEEITIPIRPLTIMFGKNSAGKSTVVQALHYAREVLLNNNPNADRTALGGTSIDLGGFRNLVHNHDHLSNVITMRFDFDVSGQEFPEYQDWDPLWEYGDAGMDKTKTNADVTSGLDFVKYHEGKNLYLELQKLQETVSDKQPIEATSSSIEFSVQWSETLEAPVVTSYKTWLCGEEAGRITTTLDRSNFTWEINLNHRFLLVDSDDEGFESERLSVSWIIVPPLPGGEFGRSVPEWGRPIYISPFSDLQEEYSIGFQTVSQLITGPGELLTGYLQEPGLKDFRYVGPIRETPPRNFVPSNTEEESDWSNGMAAWTNLFHDTDDLVYEVSEWLSSNKLKTGYTLEIERFREIPLDSKLMLALQNGDLIDRIDDTSEEVKKFRIREHLRVVDEKAGLKLEPYDIGVGISQVIPVVVSALASSSQFVAIEQPELHLHPAVQAELGDLFIFSANELHNVFILETHSEHLILRILRRIRETSTAQSNRNSSGAASDVTKVAVALMYVGEKATGLGTEILNLRIDDRGRIVDRVPGGFFEEDFAEVF